MVSLCHVVLHGTKVRANASKHKSMSPERVLGGAQQAGQDIDQRGFAGARAADKAHGAAGRDL
jgi:hypothetical protein